MEKKSRKRLEGISTKALVLLLVLVMAVGSAIGGTIAWLTAESGKVENTFTVGDININLTEDTKGPYKIVPGVPIAKDPKVTVEAGSEACWLFVEVEENEGFREAVKMGVGYKIREGENDWIRGTGEDGDGVPANVWYRQVDATEKDTEFYVLAGNETTHPNGMVTVSKELTKSEVETLKNKYTGENAPKLTFTSYAVQQDGIETAGDAWAKVNAPTEP